MKDRMEDDVVRNFENALENIKAPYLKSPEQRKDSKDGNQDVEAGLNAILKRMDELYGIVKPIIDNNGNIPSGASLEVRTIYQLFEQNGKVFTALQKNPALKGRLLNSLNVFIKEYPLTGNVTHAHTLKSSAVVAAPLQVVPNTEDATANNSVTGTQNQTQN